MDSIIALLLCGTVIGKFFTIPELGQYGKETNVRPV